MNFAAWHRAPLRSASASRLTKIPSTIETSPLLAVFFAFSLLLSSSLLMLVQPMIARMLLPHLGGSPSVWNTCMVFFQAGLLLGYGYAHLGPKWLGVGRHAVLHVVLLIGAAFLLPRELPAPAEPPAWPALWMLQTLTVGIGIPYVLLASSGSLLQMWFAKATGRDPYFLYAASNLGSFIGLLIYPLVVEPTLHLDSQPAYWGERFAILIALVALAALMLAGGLWYRSEKTITERHAISSSPARAVVLRWILLGLAPSSLLLSVTHHLTSDLASIPLLWIVPLGLYLLTFTIVFARKPMISQAVIARYVPIVIFFLVFFWLSEATSPVILVLGVPLFGFFWLTLYCHGELARTRPAAEHLTGFYFWLALGGVLGGAFNALLAPLLFSSHLEYPLVLVLIGLLRPSGERLWPISRADWLPALKIGLLCVVLVIAGRFLDLTPGPPAVVFMFVVPLLLSLLQLQPLRYSLTLGAILLVSGLYHGVQGTTLERRRGFFGTHRVTHDGDLVKLIHGNTVHGVQGIAEPKEPLAYYHRDSPVGDLLKKLKDDPRMKNVGVVGLGAGALASYGQKGQTWTFFEIDPDVIALAKSRFTYLSDSPATIGFVLGDARLTLKQSPEKFGILIIDAFGSDSIPTHLLTAEAFSIYADHMEPGGLLLIHVSNRYLDLFPVLAAGGLPQGLSAYGSVHGQWAVSPAEERAGKMTSWWAILAWNSPQFQALNLGARWRRIPVSARYPGWTDGWINILPTVRWGDVLR